MKLPFPVAVDMVTTFFDDGPIGFKKMVGDTLRQRETAIKTAGIEVVEKKSTDTPLLAAVFDEKIIVFPSFLQAGWKCIKLPVVNWRIFFK